MTDLLLSLSNITKAVYPGFHDSWKLLQIQLIQAHIHNFFNLEDVNKRGTTRTLVQVKGRLVCAIFKGEKFMCIKCREEFLQDLGTNDKDILEKLVHNITVSYPSAKHLSDHNAELKKIVQLVSETNFLCVMESVKNLLMDHDLG